MNLNAAAREASAGITIIDRPVRKRGYAIVPYRAQCTRDWFNGSPTNGVYQRTLEMIQLIAIKYIMYLIELL